MVLMTSVIGREFELKLELTHDELRRVDGHPALHALTVGQPVTRTLRSIYFDTPNQRLRTEGVSLRVRSNGEGWVQTIKSEARVANGLTHPFEMEFDITRPEPDLAAISNGKLRRKIARLVNGSTLEPAFETVVTRTARQLHTDKGDLELALDEGVVRSGSAERPLCEAELELKAGEAEGLLETATKLFADVQVRLGEASKAQRGYDLATGRNAASPQPAHAETVEVAREATCREALVLFAQSAALQIATNRQVVLETDDPEGAHQLRIGLRRLRSALKAFRPLLDTPSTREMDGHARALGRAVGELRDADVLIDEIYAPVAGLIKGHAGLQLLKNALQEHRSERRGAARAALCDKHWSALQLYFPLLPPTLDGVQTLNKPVTKFAGKALNKAWKKVARMGKHFSELDDEQRHEMRKSLKKLRYTAEFFGSLYNPRPVRSFVKQLKTLQNVFGYVNDVVTAGQLEKITRGNGGGHPDCQLAAGYVLGWHCAQSTHRWQGAAEIWHELVQETRFWD
jgi:triphosphatase